MEHFKKGPLFSSQVGRLLRTMAVQTGDPFEVAGWSAATDLYETEDAFIIYMDLSGVAPEQVSVVAEETRITVSGNRGYPVPERVRRVHRLEIERGFFEKTVPLPGPIDVAAAKSVYQHGLLVLTCPKARSRGPVRIQVR